MTNVALPGGDIAANHAALAVERFVGTAKGFRLMGEEGKHQNTGYIINWFLKRTQLDPGYPWCAAYVAHCGYEALFVEEAASKRSLWPLPLTASCQQLGDWVRKNHPVAIVASDKGARGNIFLAFYPELDGGRFGHTGIILQRNADGSYLTIEGNTNTDGSRDGWQVCYKTRRFGKADMLIDWTKLL